MLETKSYQPDTEIWYQLLDKEKAYTETRQTFLNCHNRVDLIRTALQNPSERATALKILEYLTDKERHGLFDELIQLASVGHSDIELVRSAILLFEKQWLLGNIENYAEPVLKHGTDEEYRRFLELYFIIDRQLSERLVAKALKHSDPEIQEAGEDFNNYLKTRQ